jgi:zinc D-Ala-D-Ala carboxypeptidase
MQQSEDLEPVTIAKASAADIEIPGVPNSELAEWIRDNLEYTQLILEFYTRGVPDSGWVHASFDPANLKKQVLTATKRERQDRLLARASSLNLSLQFC